LWCWGSNASQQLGVSGRSRAVSPVRIGEDDDWIWIAAGGTQTCGIRRGNVLYCWGDNADGQVGIGRVGPDGNLVPTGAPALVTMTSGWVRVEAGQAHACAIKNSQEMYCWGRGDDGQLGLDSDSSLDMPMKLPQGILWRQMALGAAHSCALDTNEPQSRMLCWGANDRGQLGTGDTDPHREPQVVSFSE
jgi:alpha-tubulin suppressor-like RCC1 family protein